MQKVINTLNNLIQKKYSLQAGKIAFPPANPEIIRQRLRQYDFVKPKPLNDLLLETADILDRWNLDTSHPRYWGLFNGPAHFSSVAADALAAAYNPQLSSWSHSAAASEIELHVIRFFLNIFGMDQTSGFGHFTSGGSESNTTALLCALNHHFPEYQLEGAIALKKRPLIYVSEYTHHSLRKAASCVGLGLNSLRIVPTDDNLKMDLNQLNEMIERDKRDANVVPFLVVATAGTTSTGVIDPLLDIARFSLDNNLWYHIDAAWGGAAAFSSRLKPLLDGIQFADSVTFDAHKWMAVSMGAGLFLCKDKSVLEKTFGLLASYMPDLVEGTTDLHKTSFQWSRRFTGLKVFFALAEQGVSGLGEQIERQTDIGAFLRKRLLEKDWTVLNSTPLPVICFTHPAIRSGATTTKEILSSIYEARRNWISETRIGNETILRACVTHPQSTQADVEMLIEDLTQALRSSTTVLSCQGEYMR